MRAKRVGAATLGLILALSVVALSGCGGNPDTSTTTPAESKTSSLVGEWVAVSGDSKDLTLSITADVYTKHHPLGDFQYRYTIDGDTQLTLTPMVTRNGVSFDDTAKTTTQRYNFDGTTLKLDTGSTFARAGTPEADKATKAVDDTSATKDCDDSRKMVARVMSEYAGLKDSGLMKVDMTFDQTRDFLVQKKALTIVPASAGHDVGDFSLGDLLNSGSPSIIYTAVGNSELKCQGGGTYTANGWEANQYDTKYPKFTCSVHGKQTEL